MSIVLKNVCNFYLFFLHIFGTNFRYQSPRGQEQQSQGNSETSPRKNVSQHDNIEGGAEEGTKVPEKAPTTDFAAVPSTSTKSSHEAETESDPLNDVKGIVCHILLHSESNEKSSFCQPFTSSHDL